VTPREQAEATLIIRELLAELQKRGVDRGHAIERALRFLVLKKSTEVRR